MNKHTHRHCVTCFRTAKGKCGCRMCFPYAHDGSELRKDTTDGSVLANMLFDGGDVHDGNPTLSACTGSNAVVCLLGASAPAKNTGIYMAKFLAKDPVEINVSATVLTDSAGQNREDPSNVDDKSVTERP